MENDVIEILGDKIIDMGEPFGKVILIDPNQFVPVTAFASMFDCPLTYEALIAKDAGVLGYKAFFDQCKAEGLLK